MRLINELRNEPIAISGAREVEELVHVRGFDGGERLRFECHTPTAVVVRESGTIRRLTLPESPRVHPLAIAAPVAVYLLARTMTKSTKRRRR